ncbi:uncharacterized protein LOC135199314 [Macrobrachium nipponense]|uniref:uncharacterized protein LOC135199314 n=1 Tax=Macrobrachium nipponense TaxID=159736 RepID=UPI0030C7F7EE
MLSTMKCLKTLVLLLMADALVSAMSNCTSDANTPHSRKKRLIFITSERRLTLPPETLLVLTPTLSIPVARNLPTGYHASMTISIPFKIAFDDLGLTSEENPWGLWPAFFRRRRDTTSLPGINWAGGDREMLYQVVEDALHNMGLDGKACLLRAICEVFQLPLINHGFFGEVLELFLSASRAPHADKRLDEYSRAERIGRSSGECFEYHEACQWSLFTNPGQLHWEDEDIADEGVVGQCSKSASYEQTNKKDAFFEIPHSPSKTNAKKTTAITKFTKLQKTN